MNDLLSKEGYEVVTAKDGLSALDTLKRYTPDVIFVDLIMPRIDGKQLCRVIRRMKQVRDAYVIVLSATVIEDGFDIDELGVSALLAKVPLKELASNILWVLNHPDEARSRCLAGEVIGSDKVFIRKITRELLSVKKHFEVVLETIPAGILEITSQGKLIYANRKAVSLLHITEDRVLGASFGEIFGKDNRQRVEGLLKTMGETAAETEDDSPLTINDHRLNLAVIPTGGSDANTLVIINDVTGETEARGTLKAAKEQMEEIIEKNSDAMVIVNSDGTVLFANPAAEVLFKRGRDVLVGGEFGFPVVPDESIELDLVGPDRTYSVAEMRIVEIEWIGEKAYLVSLRDITRRKEMEKSLRSANQMILDQQKTLIEEERLRVLLEMAGATVHELSQPLMTLLGNIDLLKTEKDVPKTLSNRLANIVDSGKKISAIVRKIRAMRRYETRPYAGGATIIDFHQKAALLLVEESDRDYEAINAIFKEEENIHLRRARSMAEAFKFLEHNEIDLILMDYVLTDGNALQFIKTMNDKGMEIPVVVTTGSGDEMTATRVIQAGAADYLPKEFITKEFVSRSVSNALEKGRLNKELKKVREKLTEMATIDDLTGLYNRRYAMEALETEIERAKRYHTPLTLCMIDLDRFKNVNDRYGHPAGDAVLTDVGKLLNDSARQTDIACRYGGEEFVLILPNTDEKGAMVFCERLREDVAQHEVEWNGTFLGVTISIGVAQYDNRKDPSPTDLVERADKALYRAKEEGRNRVCRF